MVLPLFVIFWKGVFPCPLTFFFFPVFHNDPFAVFSSCAHGAQLKYDVWIFWETRIVSTKLFKISYRRKKKFGLVGAVARMGVENVSPACDRRQEHNPSILSVPVTNYPWIRCYFTHAHSQRCCRVFARNAQHTDADPVWTLLSISIHHMRPFRDKCLLTLVAFFGFIVDTSRIKVQFEYAYCKLIAMV